MDDQQEAIKKPFTLTIDGEDHRLDTICPLCGANVNAEFTGELFTTENYRTIAEQAILYHVQHYHAQNTANDQLRRAVIQTDDNDTLTYIIASNGAVWTTTNGDEGFYMHRIEPARVTKIADHLLTSAAERIDAAELLKASQRDNAQP